MAETLGVVASGISLMQLAGAIISSSIRLKQLFQEVQDVPETITFYLDQIEVLNPMIWLTEDEQDQNTSGIPDNIRRNNLAFQKASQNCQRILSFLTGLLDDLKDQIKSSRPFKKSIGRLKVILKKDILAKYERRLELSLQLLLVSQQGCLMYDMFRPSYEASRNMVRC